MQLCKSAARLMPIDQFTDRYQGFFLLAQIPGDDGDDWDLDFQTGMLSLDSLQSSRRYSARQNDDGDEEPDDAPGSYLLEVKKHADNSWLDWIAIGRARNNDVVLRHQSVSKLHARVHVDESGALWLTDMKSTTGTWVNDVPLVPSQPQRLEPGDEVRFGQVICDFLDPPTLYRRLGGR
jgi:pSer/pThr/pTyr-binding forkhead associated (FHA) protein